MLLIYTLGSVSVAEELPENNTGHDAGLAAVWIVSEISQGGYLKPAMNFTMLDNDAHLMWEFEGGWRFTNWFKFGASLKRTIAEVDTTKSHVTMVGFVAGASGRNLMLGDFTLDLSVGSFDTGDLDEAVYYIEPGLHIRRHLHKKFYWTSGITYRYVEDQSVSLLGNNSFNSVSFKVGLVNSKY